MNKQEVVKKFLLTPIFRDYTNQIKFHNGIIGSGQNYDHEFDPDMSNIAIKFYKIIYDIDIINNDGSIIGSESEGIDTRIAGDTMCSFNTVANKFESAGNCKANRTPYPCWPLSLQRFRILYHCLANFWLLPLNEGRTLNGKYKVKDYMDKYLKQIKNNYTNYFKSYKTYINQFDSFETFSKKHFLIDSNYISNDKIVEFSDKDPEQIVAAMINFIEARADAISKSEYQDKLYNLYLEIRSKGIV